MAVGSPQTSIEVICVGVSTQSQIRRFAQLPDWILGYEEPVIRSKKTNGSRYHKPDLDSDEPQPLCGGTRAQEFSVKERSVLEGFYSPCQHHRCYGGEQ